MVSDPRLEKLRNMDPVIGTFTAQNLVKNPVNVKQTYLDHAATHMSLGNTATYVDTLIRWTVKNKGAIVGAISGEYGYGKTSMAIHLWQACEQAGILAVPPVEWHRLQDLIDATYAWTRYRLDQIKPATTTALDRIYTKYRERSVQEFAEEQDIPLSKVQDMLARKAVNINCHSEDVVEFWAEVNALIINNDLHLSGPVVFTDELQVTMSRYQADHRSRDEFMEDIFELLNSLSNKQGSFGLMIGLPLNTETVIGQARPDILQRLQTCNLFIRPSSMYQRDFPAELWRKFSEIYEYEDLRDQILPDDTLDSIGQIAFRSDLGAGPRTVVEVMRYAIERYDKTGAVFTPIDLADAYVDRQVAFDSGGKLVAALAKVLQLKDVQQIPDGARAVKLMAAFPMGCPDDRFRAYGLEEAKEAVAKRIWSEYLSRFQEGVSLRELALTERRADPRFIELTREFIQTYSESDRDLKAAIRAFQEVVVKEQLLKLLKPRRADQIEGWTVGSKIADQYVGTFDVRYPERQLIVRVLGDRSRLCHDTEEFGIGFEFDSGCSYSSAAAIQCANDAGTVVIFCLNHLRRSDKPLNIPFIGDLGYPVDKVTPTFLLALVQHLKANENLIPEDEKRTQVPLFVKNLVDYSVQLLFGEDLQHNAPFEGLSKVGLPLVEEVFSQMCRSRYGNYQTLITTGRWERGYATYVTALSSKIVSSSLGVLRGSRTLELPEKEATNLFGETRKQTFYGLAENLAGVLEVKADSREKVFTIRFKLHPAEEAFMEALRASGEKVSRGQLKARVLGRHEGLNLLRGLGYRESEVSLILQILNARRLVAYDEKQQCFVEALESPDERREAILAALNDLVQRIAVLSQIPDFDKERYAAKVEKLSVQVAACSDIERLEDYQTQLSNLREVLAQFMQTWERTIQANLDRLHQEINALLKQSLPTDLIRSLKSDVSWIGELVQCQALLKDKYQRASTTFREVQGRATGAWNTWKSSNVGDAKALLALHTANVIVQSDLRDAQQEWGAAVAYYKSYLAWSNVLNAASRAYHDATECEVSYGEGQFKRELEAIFSDLAGRFQKQRLEALSDHEMIAEQIRAVQSQIDAWLRERRENFMKLKLAYEEMFRSLGVDRANLRAVFDPFDATTSLANLYSEVIEKIGQYIQSLEQDLNRYRMEILYAERVVNADVLDTSGVCDQARADLAKIKLQITDDSARQVERFRAQSEALQGVAGTVRAVEQRLRGIMQKREPNPEEECILNALLDPKGADLSTVIAGQLAANRELFSLDQFMQMVTSLFKKNQIIIRLEKRR